MEGRCCQQFGSFFPALMLVMKLTIFETAEGQELRLVGGSSYNEGRVEVYYDGQWGTICDDSWDDFDAGVVCRQLGFPDNGTAVRTAGFGHGIDPIWLDDVNCTGSESNIGECGSNGWGVHNCFHSEDAGVQCQLDVRLVGGTTSTEGRVEIFHDGKWGTICDNSWDDNDASVVCRQLGLGVAGTAVCCAEYGKGTDVIWLSNVDCSVSGNNLTECGNSGWEIHNCSHNEDGGVRCTSDADLRLVGGSSDSEGRVEVYYDGQWGTICDDDWDDFDAGVVCRQLGFSDPSTAVQNAGFGQGAGQIWLDDVDCTGSEGNIGSCRSNGWGNHDCLHHEDAGVRCTDVRLVGGTSAGEGRVEVYRYGQWATICDDNWDDNDAIVICRQLGFRSSGTAVCCAEFGEGVDTIWLSNVTCSGSEGNLASCGSNTWRNHNCSHNQDAGVRCTTALRLVGGSSINKGRVEVYYEGQWGTICDDFWDDDDAEVVCRQLGFQGSSIAVRNAGFGQGVDPIWLDDVNCVGSESDIGECGSYGWGYHDCDHSEDAGVQCGLAILDNREIRFFEGNETGGKVETFLEGKWRTVCDGLGDFNDALVLCRHLGFKGSYGIIPGILENVRTGDFVNLLCDGVEGTIPDCDYNLVFDCMYEDALVSCRTYDHGDVRIAGANITSGLVEVYFDMSWVAVCSDGWDLTDADVFCRQLGFIEAIWTFEDTEITSDMFYLNRVDCSGNEEELLECAHTTSQDCRTNSSARVACKVPGNGMARLAGGSDMYSGRLEIFFKGEWGSVCDIHWNREDTNEVCRQLGYGNALRHTVGSFPFGAGTGPILSCCSDCHDSEVDLLSCSPSADSICHHNEDVGAVCERSNFPRDFPVRLVGGIGTPYSGRVEVLVGDQWGTICDNQWDIRDANVVCRQLGFGIALDAETQASFGRGTGPIVFTQMKCLGTESNLWNCSESSGIGSGNIHCSHDDDAGVICSGACVQAQCPPDVQNTLEADSDEISVSWTEPSSVISPCGAVTFESSHSPGDTFKEGDTVVSYRFEDTSGAQDSCNFTVTVTTRESGIPVVAVIIPTCAFVLLIIVILLLRHFKVPKGLWERSLPPLPQNQNSPQPTFVTPSKNPVYIHSEDSDSCSDEDYTAVGDEPGNNIYAKVGAIKNDVTANEKSQRTFSSQRVSLPPNGGQSRDFKGIVNPSIVSKGNLYTSQTSQGAQEMEDQQEHSEVNKITDSKKEPLYSYNIAGDVIQKEVPVYFEHDPDAGMDESTDEDLNDDVFVSEDDRGQHNSQSAELCNVTEAENGKMVEENGTGISTEVVAEENSVKESQSKNDSKVSNAVMLDIGEF